MAIPTQNIKVTDLDFDQIKLQKGWSCRPHWDRQDQLLLLDQHLSSRH